MSGLKGKLGMLAAMVALSGGLKGNEFDGMEPHKIRATPKQPPIPKGCKEYWFNSEGIFSNGGNSMLKSEVVFYCVAVTDKSAKRKFDNFINEKK